MVVLSLTLLCFRTVAWVTPGTWRCSVCSAAWASSCVSPPLWPWSGQDSKWPKSSTTTCSTKSYWHPWGVYAQVLWRSLCWNGSSVSKETPIKASVFASLLGTPSVQLTKNHRDCWHRDAHVHISIQNVLHVQHSSHTWINTVSDKNTRHFDSYLYNIGRYNYSLPIFNNNNFYTSTVTIDISFYLPLTLPCWCDAKFSIWGSVKYIAPYVYLY